MTADKTPKSGYAGFQDKIFHIVETAHPGPYENISKYFDLTIMTLIFFNVLAVILQTVEDYEKAYGAYFIAFELMSLAIFSLEYLLRLWACTASEAYQHPIKGRLKFALEPMNLIDLFAILPSLFGFQARQARALRLIRIFRVLKLGRYYQSLQTLGTVVQNKKEELLVTLFVVTMLLLFASSFIYHFEHEAQEEKFSSIPAAMWWGVATLTTVGYGDVYPITPAGRFFAAVIAVLGVGVFALPAGILASGFAEELERRRAGPPAPQPCPHCGKNIHSPPEPEAAAKEGQAET